MREKLHRYKSKNQKRRGLSHNPKPSNRVENFAGILILCFFPLLESRSTIHYLFSSTVITCFPSWVFFIFFIFILQRLQIALLSLFISVWTKHNRLGFLMSAKNFKHFMLYDVTCKLLLFCFMLLIDAFLNIVIHN